MFLADDRNVCYWLMQNFNSIKKAKAIMKFKTHLAFGLLIGLMYLNYAEVQNKFLFILFIMLGSALPDIDNASSKIGKKAWPLSKLIQMFLGHRGIFHSIWLIILIPGVVYLYLSKIYGIALFIGYFSHVLMDGFTKKGVNFLNPFLELRLSGFVETGSIIEKIVFIAVTLLDIFLMLKILVI